MARLLLTKNINKALYSLVLGLLLSCTGVVPNEEGLILISGNLMVDEKLIAEVKDKNTINGDIQFQWFNEDGSEIMNTASNTLIITKELGYKKIFVTANYIDANGYEESLRSETSDIITFKENPFLGDKKILEQKDIDDFGNQNYTSFIGNLEIGEASSINITSLSTLNSLNFIDGNLSIKNNVNLTSLEGLENIKSITGNLYIGHTAIDSLDKLNALTSVGGKVEVHNNNELVSLKGLDNLTSIDVDNSNGQFIGLSILGNNKLASLTGLNNLSLVKGTIKITDNPVLDDFCALKFLVVYESFTILGNLLNPDGEEIRKNCPSQ